MATDRTFLMHLENPVVGIRDQYLALKQYCPGTVEILDNDKTVQWEGMLQPTPISREYKVVIRYTLNHPPVCVVKSPDLTILAEGQKIPHIYQNQTSVRGTQLCLYLPTVKQKNKVSEWQPNMFLANSILPWASMWLLYFEFWLSSGKWDGGGVEHDDSDGNGR